MITPVIIYHDNCFDGIAAAWATSKGLNQLDQEFEENNLERTQLFIPRSYGQSQLEIGQLHNKDVYIVDFSFPRETMIHINKTANSLLVLDHHKTAQADCEGLEFCVFDMNRSGAGMAWDHFFTAPRPKLIDYIEDRDLWQFKLPASKEIHAYIASFPKDIKLYDNLSDTLERDLSGCIAEGQAILRFKDQKVEEIASEARLTNVDGYTVPIANSPYQFGSDVAHVLLDKFPKAPFAGYFCITQDLIFRYGLRGRDSDNFDVSSVAKSFGGGGHKKAAGFERNEML